MVSWLVPRRRGGKFEASLLAKHIPQDDCREYDWQHHNRCYEHDRPSAEFKHAGFAYLSTSRLVPRYRFEISGAVPRYRLGWVVLCYFRLRATRTNHPSTKGCSRRRHATRSNLQTTWSGWTGSGLAVWHGCGEEASASHRDSIRPRGRLNAISVCYQQIGGNGPLEFIQMLVLVDDQIRPKANEIKLS